MVEFFYVTSSILKLSSSSPRVSSLQLKSFLSSSKFQGIQDLCEKPRSSIKYQNKKHSQCYYHQEVTRILRPLCQELDTEYVCVCLCVCILFLSIRWIKLAVRLFQVYSEQKSGIFLCSPCIHNVSVGIHIWVELNFKEIHNLPSHPPFRDFCGDLKFEAVLEVYFCMCSVQSLSRVRLCDPMNGSTPGLPVHHQLPEFTQTHVH